MCRPGGYLLLLCLVAVPAVATGQVTSRPGEEGVPFFAQQYTSRDYHHHPQNWAVVQDPRGVIYVANYDGLLEYDGVEWRFIQVRAGTVVRSLAVDAAGRVYVGTRGDFGYLAADSTGLMRYVSLLDEQRVRERYFTDVWGTRATRDAVYFQSYERLYRWNGRRLDVWASTREFRTSFVVHDRFYVRDRGVGLLTVVGDSLRLAPGGARFADLPVYVMAPYGPDRVLVGTSTAGFFLYDGVTATPFPTEVDDRLKEGISLYHGCVLPGGYYALATLGGGVLIIDADGRLVQVLNKSTGFPDDWVNYVYADAQGGLWAALDAEGVVRVDAPSQLTVYDDRHGLEGTIRFIRRYGDVLYVGTTTALLKMVPSATTGRPAGFVDVLDGIPTSTVLAADSVLLAATDRGLFVLREGEAPDRRNEVTVYTLLASRHTPGRIFAGYGDSLAVLHPAGGLWIMEAVATERPLGEVKAMAEEDDGTLWLGGSYGIFWRFPRGMLAAPPESYGLSEGLPEGPVHVITVHGEAVFLTQQGVFRFAADPAGASSFYPDSTLISASDTSAPLRSLIVDDDGRFWIVHEDHVDIATPGPGGTFGYEKPAVLQFPKEEVTRVYVEHSGVAWIGNGNELIRYDPAVPKTYDAPFTAQVRRIVETGTEGLVYGGAPRDAAAALPVLGPAFDNLRFDVAAPSYNDVDANQYQYRLDGVDKDWSAWNYRPYKVYNDLGGKTYTFHVRARNAQGTVSAASSVTLRILPPWYRTGWAYALYAGLAVFVSVLAWRYRTVVEENKRAQEQARELARERLVNERLQEANGRLQEANEGLQQVNRLKDEFLATTSHELRTPLTAILGFAAILQEEVGASYRDLLDPIESNGQRLLRTVNSLLDLARLRAGMMEVQPEIVNVEEQVAEVLRLLAPLARRKDLRLDLVGPAQPVFVYLDPRYFEQILSNLIGNAIKFTPKGRVGVSIEQHGERIRVEVSDTGIGIDESFMPYLFEEFKQESSGLARLHEGSGLGLTITARLVALMGGDITVRSTKGEGTVFTVTFPAHVAAVSEPTTA